MSADLSTILNSALLSCLTPSSQLTIVPNKKSWLVNIDALVLADCGNIFDAILIAVRGALWDLRIPRTRGIEFEARDTKDEAGNQDSMKALLKQRRKVTTGAEFDLEDYWDEGEHLKIRNTLPIGMTLNLVRPTPPSDRVLRLDKLVLIDAPLGYCSIRYLHIHSSTHPCLRKKVYWIDYI